VKLFELGTYLPYGCINSHRPSPGFIELRLAAGVSHKVHLFGVFGDAEKRLVGPHVELPSQQEVSDGLIALIALVQDAYRNLLELAATCIDFNDPMQIGLYVTFQIYSFEFGILQYNIDNCRNKSYSNLLLCIVLHNSK